MSGRTFLLIVLAAFAGALGGVYAGRLLSAPPQAGAELHELLHRELQLDRNQEAQIENLERQFAIKTKALELEMRADNAALAAAIEAEHDSGPRVVAAITRHHDAMGRLQIETLEHIFAMRKVLRTDQAEKFDRAVVDALTDEPR